MAAAGLSRAGSSSRAEELEEDPMLLAMRSAQADMPSTAARPTVPRASCRSRTMYDTGKWGCEEEEADPWRAICCCILSCTAIKLSPCCCKDATCGGLTVQVMHTTYGRLQTM